MGRLTPEKIEKILETYAKTLSMTETAKIENCTEDTVSFHVHKSREQVQKDTAKQVGSADEEAALVYARLQQGDPIVKVCIDLRIPAHRGEQHQKDFWRLTRMTKLARLYDEYGDEGILDAIHAVWVADEKGLDLEYLAGRVLEIDDLDAEFGRSRSALNQVEQSLAGAKKNLEGAESNLKSTPELVSQEKKLLEAASTEKKKILEATTKEKEIEEGKIKEARYELAGVKYEIKTHDEKLKRIKALIDALTSSWVHRRFEGLVKLIVEGFLSSEKGRKLVGLLTIGLVTGLGRLDYFGRFALLNAEDESPATQLIVEEWAKRRGFNSVEGFKKLFQRMLESSVDQLEKSGSAAIVGEIAKGIKEFANDSAFVLAMSEQLDLLSPPKKDEPKTESPSDQKDDDESADARSQ
ncbi:MAG: hypothetical protein OK422_01775 [Thaumarchaeota archaeon]|nr:hypothetical protein [Nitrososphaerota archaeon]